MKNKRILKLTAAVSAICMITGLLVPVLAAAEQEFYVSLNGSDLSDGSRNSPFRTIERAKTEVKKYNKDMQGDIIVNIEAGVYYQTESIDFLPEDSGYNGHNVIYRGIDNPTVSGGVAVSGFAESTRKEGVYELYLPEFTESGIYQLYNLDGGRRQLAKLDSWIIPQGDYSDPNTEYTYDGIYFNSGDIPTLCDVKESEVVWYRGWTVSKFHPERVIETNGKTAITFANPMWNYYQTNNKDGVVSANAKVSCYLQNDFSLLDKPGEFYYDKSLGKLYYIPLEFEDMSNEVFVVPKLETFAFFMGEKTAEKESDSIKVRNITFDGIKFSHFACDKSYESKFVSGQGPSYSGRTRATYSNDNGAIYLNRADNINFYNNDFTEMVQTPINMRNDVSNCNIENNAFYNLSSSAIEIGATEHIVGTFSNEVEYVIKKFPRTDYNMMLLNPYISASSFYNDDGSGNFANLTIMPSTSNTKFYPEISFNHTSVQKLNDYKYYGNPGTWKGKKAWIKYDFYRKYTFSQIALAFDPEEIPTENRVGFEVLLSNDEKFGEGNYIKVGESNDYGEIVNFDINDKDKYRYLMVRALDDNEFAVTNIYSFTPDFPHQIVRRTCNNININNNYINNAACDEFSNSGIFVYCCDNLNITHNEISNLPYTGISYGLNWGSTGLCGKGNISNNYIHNVNKILYDGGAIYTLGNHDGSTINENYICNVAGGVGLYFDNGSCGITANDNVEEISRSSATFNAGSKNCTLNKLYSASGRLEIAEESSNTISEPVIYNLYDKNSEAERIKSNAGTTTDFNKRCLNEVYNSSSYDLIMGLESNCKIVANRLPWFCRTVSTALSNAANSDKIPSNVKDKIIDMCNRCNTVNAKNAVNLAELAENIFKYSDLWHEGSINYVNSDKVTDFEIDEKSKTIRVYSDSASEFVPEFVCSSGTLNIGAVSCGNNYDLRSADGELWKVEVKDSVEINLSENEKITNIGKKPLLKIDFHYTEGIKDLNVNNVTITRKDTGKTVKQKPYRLTDKSYIIDNSVFASYSADADGKIATEKVSDYDVQISINNLRTNSGVELNNIVKTGTVDRNILPIKYIEGKFLKNVARGKQPDGVCTDIAEHFRLTDESGDNYDRYRYTARVNQERDGYCFRIDFDGWYDIAAFVIESTVGRNNAWDNNNSRYGFSKVKTNFMDDTDIVFDTGYSGIVNGQRRGLIFDKDNLPRYRYFLGGPNDKRKLYEGELLLGDVYVYAYVNESELPAKEFNFTKYQISYSENAAWGVAETNGESDVEVVLALYKNGKLADVKSDGGKSSLRTGEIKIPEEWSNFPNKNSEYELKLLSFSGFEKLDPYTEPETEVVPQIACWGDSYTYNWPEQLQELLGGSAEVYNLGIDTNTAADIAGRQGGVPIVLSEGVTLNNGEPIKLNLKSSIDKEGYDLKLYDKLNEYSDTINPCSLNGISGKLSYSDGNYIFSDYTADNVELPQGTKLVTNQEAAHKNDIQIIMCGANAGYGKNMVYEWAVLEQAMVKNIGGNRKRYIVMTVPINDLKNVYANMNKYRKVIFGEHFLNLYEKLTNADLLRSYGIELSDNDLVEIENGMIPASLRKEKSKLLNDKGFELIGRLVYEKLIELGYAGADTTEN